MNEPCRINLNPGKEASIRRFHPWLFSGAIKSTEGSPQAGDIVEVFSSGGQYLATGHFDRASIAVKIFSFSQVEINYSFWQKKLEDAFWVRQSLGLTESSMTNAYRLVFGEGDGLPGLIIDYYHGVCVIQTQTAGMERMKDDLAKILQGIYGDRLKAVYHKTDSAGAGSYLYGLPQTGLITETGHQFLVDWEKGQKTGFFLDQRTNRMFAQFYARDKQVLNAFSYSGAFTVYALKGGASMVHSIDSSRQAIRWTDENLKLNNLEQSRHVGIIGDVKKYLVEPGEKYDLIILDPPAFAKTHQVSHNALQAYRFINARAISRLSKGGMILTFSCSQAISREMFKSMILAAALESGREIRIVHQLSQGPDHPVSVYHPEGDYLKGVILIAS
ncbi:MAG: class I SAM-dependent rRNA methyltransferase [Bacteroidetes bacterium]|nr:class I SAM-dependent rRNA methyltransferase [Bacteroidota bacterium]